MADRGPQRLPSLRDNLRALDGLLADAPDDADLLALRADTVKLIAVLEQEVGGPAL
jgi:hypothetical protein